MNELRRKKARELIQELAAIRVEVCVLRDDEREAMESVMSVLEVQALGDAVEFIEQAIGAMKGAVS